MLQCHMPPRATGVRRKFRRPSDTIIQIYYTRLQRAAQRLPDMYIIVCAVNNRMESAEFPFQESRTINSRKSAEFREESRKTPCTALTILV